MEAQTGLPCQREMSHADVMSSPTGVLWFFSMVGEISPHNPKNLSGQLASWLPGNCPVTESRIAVAAGDWRGQVDTSPDGGPRCARLGQPRGGCPYTSGIS